MFGLIQLNLDRIRLHEDRAMSFGVGSTAEGKRMLFAARTRVLAQLAAVLQKAPSVLVEVEPWQMVGALDDLSIRECLI